MELEGHWPSELVCSIWDVGPTKFVKSWSKVGLEPGRVAQSVTCLATDAGLTADPGVASSIPYFSGDWLWNNFYGNSPPFRWIFQEGLVSVTSESMCTKHWLTACSSLTRKKCGQVNWPSRHDHGNKTNKQKGGHDYICNFTLRSSLLPIMHFKIMGITLKKYFSIEAKVIIFTMVNLIRQSLQKSLMSRLTSDFQPRSLMLESHQYIWTLFSKQIELKFNMDKLDIKKRHSPSILYILRSSTFL